jgi:hypothetical protein
MRSQETYKWISFGVCFLQTIQRNKDRIYPKI